MIRKIPIIGSQATLGDIARAIARAGNTSVRAEFESAISGYAGSRFIYPVNSGIAAFYVILMALSRLSRRTEVLLPAYTAGSLIVAVRKAGLKPILYDISLKDFNGDIDSLMPALSGRTLAVVCVHMFGIGMAGIAGLREKLPQDVALVEDCAQAMGSAIEETAVGNFGDAAFFSFNRGKNMPVCGGGCIATNNERISKTVSDIMKELPAFNAAIKLPTLFKTIAFSLAARPYIYGCVYRLASRFKETSPPADFDVSPMSAFQCAIGLALLKRFEGLAARRRNNGIFLMAALKDLSGVDLSAISAGNRTVFNRFPIMFEDPHAPSRAAEKLWRSGIESSPMYVKPLHHMFDLGYKKEEFPNACYLAERILTLPIHPSVRRDDLSKAAGVIRGILA